MNGSLDSPFHRFRGVRLLALIFTAIAYSFWFTAYGPYSQLAGLAPGLPLEEAMHYSGAHAVSVLGQLDGEGRKIKYLSLALDVPFMVLFTLMTEGLIAFGLRHMGLMSGKWRLLFAVPLIFLVCDVLEDSFLALTLASGAELMGTFAGIMTPLKMLTSMLASLLALIFGLGGLLFWLTGKSKLTKQG